MQSLHPHRRPSKGRQSLNESPGSKNRTSRQNRTFKPQYHNPMKLKITVLTMFLACGMLLSFAAAQQPAASPANAAGAAPTVHNKSLFEQIREGGWVMIPIGLCSVLTVY